MMASFYVNSVPGRPIGGPDGLPQQLQGESEPTPAEEDDIEETIEASLAGGMGGKETGTKQQGGSLRNIVRVKTGRGIQREIEGHWRISGEPEVAGRKNSKGNATILAESQEIHHLS
jgi:hypothetical protein